MAGRRPVTPAPGDVPAPVVADDAGAEPRDPSVAELGHRIRMLRVTRGLTLKDLEQRGGISATHISEVERGRASPTVGALARIAHALGLRPAALVAPTALPEVRVRRASADAGPALHLGTADVDPLGGRVREGSLGAMLVSLPTGREPAFSHRHAGEEWVTVLGGVVEVRVGDSSWLLREGDSIHFRGHRPHSFANRTSAPATLVVANRPGASLQDSA